MAKGKISQKPKSYWDILIKEVKDGKHRQAESTAQMSSNRVTYDLPYERRGTKYLLGEPLTSVYFTQREAECMMQILQGKTMNETADILNLSPRTVEYYLNKIKRKLNCHKKRDLIKLVSQTDFIKIFQKDPYNQT